VDVHDYSDYNIDGKVYSLLNIDLKVNKKTNCDIFMSCRKTKYATQVTSMGNAIGFTTFQGKNAYKKAPIMINMSYVDKGGLTYDIDPCNTWPDSGELHQFKVYEKCTCNACDLNCFYDKTPSMAVLEGFGVFKVLVVYGIVALATIVIFFVKRQTSKRNRTWSAESEPINMAHSNSENFTSTNLRQTE
jgi:hypothetical protein